MKTRRIIIMLLISSFMMSCFGVTVVNAKSYFDESTFVSGAILDERTPVLDASYIQDYLAGNISSFPNGFVALLG